MAIELRFILEGLAPQTFGASTSRGEKHARPSKERLARASQDAGLCRRVRGKSTGRLFPYRKQVIWPIFQQMNRPASRRARRRVTLRIAFLPAPRVGTHAVHVERGTPAQA